MDITLVLISLAVGLIGLKLCDVDKNSVEAMADAPGICPWTNSNLLRIFYGIMQIAGVIYTLGMTLYLSFAEHWWYILVYLVAVPVAIGISSLLKLLLSPLSKYHDGLYARVFVNRIVGLILISSSFVLLGLSI